MLTSLISFFIYRFGKVYNLPVLIRISQAIDEWLLLFGLLFLNLFLPPSSFNEIDRSSRLISTRFPSSLLTWVGIALSFL